MKVQLPLKVDESLKGLLTKEAIEQNRSLNNYVETLLFTHPSRGGGVKNETLKQIVKSKKGKN